MAASLLLLVASLAAGAAFAPAMGAVGADRSVETLVGSQGGGPGLHSHGSVYLLDGRDVAWRSASAGSYFDVTALDDGRVVAAFVDGGYTDCRPYPEPCTRTGVRVIDPDPEPRIVEEYSFPVRNTANSEVHDVEPLPGGGYVLTDMDRERIVVVRDGEVVWEWRADEFYEAPEDPTRVDWLHINDVDRIGDGRFLVSVRNANQLLIVERGAGVVEVINEDRDDGDDDACRSAGPEWMQQLSDRDGDGDIRCGDPDVLNHQHNPQWLGDGAVLVADSENDRVVELHRDDGRWTVAWALTSAGGVDFRWPRDADRLPNGNTLITDSFNRRVIEVDESGAVVWGYRTDRVPYEADRLPAGETVGGTRYETSGDAADRPDDLPVLTPTLVALQNALPMPFWVSELHVLAAIVSAIGFAAGARLRAGPVGTGWLPGR